jgi:3-oxoacyl-[acyl-carrier-protein] synthase II
VKGPLITAVGLLNPLGLGQKEFVEAWRRGDSVPDMDSDSPASPSASGLVCARLPRFRARDFLPGGGSLLRRMDRLSQLICVSSSLACADAELSDERTELALGVGTDLGTLDETWRFLTRLRDKGPALANPMSFPNLVPNAGAGYAGILLGLQGPSQTFCQHEICGEEAVGWAADGIRARRFPAALAGGAEELGEVRLRSLGTTQCSRPGSVPGEGASMVVLEAPEYAASRGRRALAEHLGTWTGRSPVRSPLALSCEVEVLSGLLGHALSSARVDPSQVGVLLLSDPDDEVLAGAVTASLGYKVPCTDHHRRAGVHPADGAFRIALSALVLGDKTLPVNAEGETRTGPVAMVVSQGRGGMLAVTLLGETSR